MAPPGHPVVSFWGPSIIAYITPQSALFSRVLVLLHSQRWAEPGPTVTPDQMEYFLGEGEV